MKTLISTLLITATFFSCISVNDTEMQEKEKKEIIRYDRPEASILKGVYVPEGKEFFLSSGLVAPVKNADANPETYERYGNTYEQSIAILERIKETLEEGDFALENVIKMNVYIAPDADGNVQWQDWFDAYGKFFNNDENLTKVARTTIAVHSLARPDLLVEVEVVAVK